MRRLGLSLVLLLPSCSDDGLAPAQSTGSPSTGALTSTPDESGEPTPDLGDDGGATGVDTADESAGTAATSTTGEPPDSGTTIGESDSGGTAGDGGSSTSGGSSSSSGGESGSSDGGSSSGGTTTSCPEITGTSLIGGPADLYGFCWYLTAPMDTCDSACAELVGGSNLAPMAETAFPDHCDGPSVDDVSTWFFDNGNPGGWTSMGGFTSGHTLGYGYSMVGSFFGKCAAGMTEVGTYPGEIVGGGLENERQLVCACALGTP